MGKSSVESRLITTMESIKNTHDERECCVIIVKSEDVFTVALKGSPAEISTLLTMAADNSEHFKKLIHITSAYLKAKEPVKTEAHDS